MARRKIKNRTGLPRIAGAPPHDAWVAYVCLGCKTLNVFSIKRTLLDPKSAYLSQRWTCIHCGYLHSKNSALPFKTWPPEYIDPSSVKCQRFWKGFFGISSENNAAYWKQCNACGRILPSSAFSRHRGWGPLEKQMECRCCKGAINAYLNPKRTKQQLHESATKRRVGDLLLKGEGHSINLDDLFKRFGNRCFKTGKKLNKKNRKSWALDHILPSCWLYPLTKENAALLSKEANDNKRDVWPSYFYTNSELIRLAELTGADLTLLSSKTPIINPNIDVDRCVTRYLNVREHSNLEKRIRELKKLLGNYNLADRLSQKNRRKLGYTK